MEQSGPDSDQEPLANDRAEAQPESRRSPKAARATGLDQPLPSLSRESMERIRQAEKKARSDYDLDKAPYFPTNVDFSFQEAFVVRSIERIIEYVRSFAETVLDAHLAEYLAIDPSALLANETLLQSIARNVWTLADELFNGYSQILQGEPSSRRARHFLASHTQALQQSPELEPWRYPDAQRWADFLGRMAEPDSTFQTLGGRYERTIGETIRDRIRQYQNAAASRLPEPGPGEDVPEETQIPGAADVGPASRPQRVNDFLARVKGETGEKATRTHIWKLAGHKRPRQFEFWQASSTKATKADERNFDRILAMTPAQFVYDLRNKSIIQTP